jgi:hypothetical protein
MAADNGHNLGIRVSMGRHLEIGREFDP